MAFIDINSSTAQSSAMLDKLYGEAQNLANTTAANEIKQGENAALVNKTKNLAALETQQKNLDAATALGTNPNDAGYMLGQLASDMRMLYKQRDDAILATQQAQQANIFLDGPMAWLDAQVNLPDLHMQQQTSEARLKNAQDMYNNVNALTQTATVTNSRIEQTKTLASIGAEADNIMLEAQSKANDAKVKGLQFGIAGVKDAADMKQRMFNNQLQLAGEARANEQMAMARERAAEARAMHNERLAAKKQGEKDNSTYLEAVNLHRVSVGQTPLDLQQMRVKTMTQQGKLELDDAFERGLTTAQTGRKIVGNTPAEAMNSLAGLPRAINGPQMDVLEKFNTVAGAAAQGIKNPAAAATAVNKAIIEEATKQGKGTMTGNNIYASPGLKTLADTEYQRGNPTVFAKVVGPALQGGATEFNPRLLMPQMLNLVKKGEITLDQAINGISALAKKGMAYNNAHFEYDSVGLPRQAAMNLPLENTGNFRGTVNNAIETARQQGNPLGAKVMGWVPFVSGSSTQTLNVADEVALKAYASKYLAGDIAVNLQEAARKNTKTTK